MSSVERAIFPNRKYAPSQPPHFHDSEVITLALFGEMVFGGDEDKTLHFIRQYHKEMFPKLCLTNARSSIIMHVLLETIASCIAPTTQLNMHLVYEAPSNLMAFRQHHYPQDLATNLNTYLA